MLPGECCLEREESWYAFSLGSLHLVIGGRWGGRPVPGTIWRRGGVGWCGV